MSSKVATTTFTSNNNGTVKSSFSSSNNNSTKKIMAQSKAERSSASVASNDSSSDPLESDFSEGSCEEDDLKRVNGINGRKSSARKREYTLEDFQIIKTIGE